MMHILVIHYTCITSMAMHAQAQDLILEEPPKFLITINLICLTLCQIIGKKNLKK